MAVILDSSAILAVLLEEKGSAEVEPRLFGAHVCAIGLAEVTGVLSRAGRPEEEVRIVLETLDLQVHSLSPARAVEAGLLVPATRHLGLSLGDRACIALALQLKLPVMTGDRAWLNVILPGLDIRLIR